MTNIDFGDNNTSVSFKFKQKIRHKLSNVSTKKSWNNHAIKISNNFWRTLEMSLINSKINFILTWSTNSTISSNTNTNQSTTSEITDTKPYVLVVTLSRNENAKLFQQLKPVFKGTINWE